MTDKESAERVAGVRAFDRVKVVELRSGAKMEKCHLWQHLPAEYDSFAFLDSDTVLLSDVSFGFEQAERHGIAIAPAPNYNLGYHWGFREAMPSMGLADRSQLQMNTGVVFFVRRPDVEAIFKEWSALATRFSDTPDVASDQPLFTAALELLQFNPYTLSQSYNYRCLGELAVGPVHIWHSHHPVPDDLNRDVKDWPPRRFMRGRRIPYARRSLFRTLRRLFRWS